MKIKTHVSLLGLLGLLGGIVTAAPLGTAFTYQGQLTDGGQSANGVYELQFTLYDSSGGMTVVAGPLTFSTVTMTNGNFTAQLDFGSGVFTGEARWLEIGVRTNGSVADFTVLYPRQEITPTPYAHYAPNAGVAASADTATVATGTEANAVDNASLQTDSVTTDKILDGTITAAKLDSSIGIWSRSGNRVYREQGRVGIGTTDPARTLDVHGDIQTGVDGAGGRLILASQDDIEEGGRVYLHGAGAYNGWIQDVYRNSLRLYAGGLSTNDGRVEIYNAGATNEAGLYVQGNVGIGELNPAVRLEVTGNPRVNNEELPQLRLTGGGGSGAMSILDLATYDPGTNAPSARVQATDAIWGAGVDILTKQPGAIDNPLVSRFHIDATGEVGIGTNDPQAALHVVGSIMADNFSGSGLGLMTIGTTDTQPLELRVNDTPALRLEWPTSGSVPNVIGGYGGNTVGSGAQGAVIAGGVDNNIGVNADGSVISGGGGNLIDWGCVKSTISGGENNEIRNQTMGANIAGGSYNTVGRDSSDAAIGGGYQNSIDEHAYASAIGGGYRNTIGDLSEFSTIAGGYQNGIGDGSVHCTISGGTDNQADGAYATIPGGRANSAAGDYSLAAGRRAKADHMGSFVWADSTDADFVSTANNEFAVRASGGARFVGGPIKATGGLIIETRASDPPNPAPGQMWLRTNP